MVNLAHVVFFLFASSNRILFTNLRRFYLFVYNFCHESAKSKHCNDRQQKLLQNNSKMLNSEQEINSRNGITEHAIPIKI